MNEDDIKERIKYVNWKPRDKHDDMDKLITGIMDTFRLYPTVELEEYAGMFMDSWTWETGDDREKVVAVTLLWMADRNKNNEYMQSERDRKFREAILKGNQFRMSIPWK